MKDDQLLACNNEECKMHLFCVRYQLFKDGAKEFSTNGGTPQKGCKKFILKEEDK